LPLRRSGDGSGFERCVLGQRGCGASNRTGEALVAKIVAGCEFEVVLLG
jgi:hypothetical protein